jgi:hypothetical protein
MLIIILQLVLGLKKVEEREIRQNVFRVCSEFLKRCIDARRNQEYLA